ncbi:hypothetical protein YQE_02729, partial [Dendroctonus ponderosae]
MWLIFLVFLLFLFRTVFQDIVPTFVEYANLLFENFGEDVKWWTTFNEPKQTCAGGYDSGYISPQNLHPGTGGYKCAHNVLRAHAKVYRLYEQKYKPTQNGKTVWLLTSPGWNLHLTRLKILRPPNGLV